MRAPILTATLLAGCLALGACAAQGGDASRADDGAGCAAGLGSHLCDSGGAAAPSTGYDPSIQSVDGGRSGGGH